MSVPTRGEVFARLIEHLRLAQEAAAMLGSLSGMNDDRVDMLGWQTVAEGLRLMQLQVTKLAQKRLQ